MTKRKPVTVATIDNVDTAMHTLAIALGACMQLLSQIDVSTAEGRKKFAEELREALAPELTHPSLHGHYFGLAVDGLIKGIEQKVVIKTDEPVIPKPPTVQ